MGIDSRGRKPRCRSRRIAGGDQTVNSIFVSGLLQPFKSLVIARRASIDLARANPRSAARRNGILSFLSAATGLGEVGYACKILVDVLAVPGFHVGDLIQQQDISNGLCMDSWATQSLCQRVASRDSALRVMACEDYVVVQDLRCQNAICYFHPLLCMGREVQDQMTMPSQALQD